MEVLARELPDSVQVCAGHVSSVSSVVDSVWVKNWDDVIHKLSLNFISRKELFQDSFQHK